MRVYSVRVHEDVRCDVKHVRVWDVEGVRVWEYGGVRCVMW